MARSLNKVELIGNLTRDPELRYTPQGTAVCTLGLATNRSWVTDSGEKKEEADFHRLVAWNKLAELCSQLLSKGRKIYVEGRLSNRSWTGQDGAQKSITEIVINDMIILDSKREQREDIAAEEAPGLLEEQASPASEIAPPESKKKQKKEEKDAADVNPDDIPF
ncbi:MAG: Single-stranded DNA-binding protein [Candidatus Levybacteria bacterium GW2011_GWA1_39_11]|nr:MAG: Single-stranded DNA-binding protein [Candidatus Levybacteria bacterium GW2011_GWA1_39_11]